jgi:CheY-like chemotaxis protein
MRPIPRASAVVAFRACRLENAWAELTRAGVQPRVIEFPDLVTRLAVTSAVPIERRRSGGETQGRAGMSTVYGRSTNLTNPDAWRILLVDDTEQTRAPLARLLRLRGHRVHEAAHGEEALAYLEDHATGVALILLDLMMPVMNGWRFRELQLRHLVYAAIPTVVFTGILPDARTRILLRADDYLTKPVTFDQVLHVTDRFCRLPHAATH